MIHLIIEVQYLRMLSFVLLGKISWEFMQFVFSNKICAHVAAKRLVSLIGQCAAESTLNNGVFYVVVVC